jgi:hypothetical protein
LTGRPEVRPFVSGAKNIIWTAQSLPTPPRATGNPTPQRLVVFIGIPVTGLVPKSGEAKSGPASEADLEAEE